MLDKKDLDWLEETFLPKLADKVKAELATKLDDISKKLDTFIGEIQSSRTTQELHSGDHTRVNERIDRLEKKVGLPPLAD